MTRRKNDNYPTGKPVQVDTPASESVDATSGGDAPKSLKEVPLWNNTVTVVGLFLAAMSIFLLLTFGLFTLVTPTTNPYVDIVGLLVIPSILAGGVALIPFGILFKSWRVRRRDPLQQLAFRFPRFDLNDPVQRRVAKFAVAGTFILLPVVGVTGYHGYHYTDSSEFCSKACHTVMEPQATTYEFSAHARVACAECHIGSGASWFVKAKLSGTRQVLAVLRDTFSRPIAPAIHNLRPARETCEHCHWPKKFFGAQLREIVDFASDEENTRREIDMLLKTGGGDEFTGRAEGIHLHMALAGRIDYIAADESLQDIPWVRYVDASGNEWVYRSDGRPNSDPRPDGEVRQMDCMDCHNRPAHKFRSPRDAVDIFLEVGRIDTTLPFIKREAVAALIEPYTDVETAKQQIGYRLTDFYRSNYPEVWRTRKASVNQAVDMTREIYSQNFFPAMKVDWRTYADNIGHLNSPGCFRCHDGSHVNQEGGRISHDCNICHTFLNPVQLNGKAPVIREGEFVHPYTLEGSHATLRCDECHSGGLSPVPTCVGCHVEQAQFRAGTSAVFESLGIGPDAMVEAVDCEGCHDLSVPATVEKPTSSLDNIDAACMDCHEDEEERFEGMLASWKVEVDRLLSAAERRVGLDGDREILEALRRAGPLHNINAARIIATSIVEPRVLEGGDPDSDSDASPE